MSLYSPYEKKEKNQQVQQNSQNKDNNSSAPSSIKNQEQNNVHQLQPSNFTYQTYTPSVTVQQAQDLLQQQMEQKPGQYQSTWKGQLNDTINQILNRNKFSYDVNGDALYQQYKDQYVQQGKLAMMDTMGQAAALTGGYGNTYGQSVGQQAYQAYLQKLNDVVPELYGMALDQYNQEGQALYDRAALMAQQEDQDYARYMDGLNAWLNERNYLAGRYDTERDYDYGKWEGDRDFSYEQFLNDRNMGYQQERDKVADQQWQMEYDFAMQQYLDSKKASSGRLTGNPNTPQTPDTPQSPDSPGYDNGDYDKATILRAQQFLGSVPDGLWGPNSVARAKAAGYNSLEEVIAAMGGDGGNPTTDGYYDQLLGAVSTAKGVYNKQDSTTRQQAYKESVAAINDAYNSGRITAEQKKSLLRIATPGSR